MSIFWITYILAALTTVGVFSLLIRMDLKQGKVVKLNLKEGLLCGFLILCPWLNCLMAAAMLWYYISEYGSKHSITFGKGKE